MKRKALLFAAVALVALLVGSVAYAGLGTSSYASISLSQTGAYGGTWQPMSGTTTFTGANYTSATNTLYVGTYRRYVSGSNYSYAMAPGNTLTPRTPSLNTCDYQVVLDPAGPNFSGCAGWGKMQN